MSRSGFLPVAALCVLLPALVCMGWAGVKDSPWEVYDWEELHRDEDGTVFYIAPGSVMSLPHNARVKSFYARVVYGEPFWTESGEPVGQEILDRFVDCEHGQVDSLMKIRFYGGLEVARIRYRQAHGKKVKPGSRDEVYLRRVCDKVPEWLSPDYQEPERHRGGDPKYLKR